MENNSVSGVITIHAATICPKDIKKPMFFIDLVCRGSARMIIYQDRLNIIQHNIGR